MRKTIGNILKYTLSLAIAAVFVWLVIRKIEWDSGKLENNRLGVDDRPYLLLYSGSEMEAAPQLEPSML